MKYLNLTFLVFIITFFSACSFKQPLNLNEINSISLNKNIVVAGIPQTYQTPISVGIGVGGMVSSHVGVGINTFFNPRFSNNEDLRLQDSFYKNGIQIASLIENEFTFQMKNDELFKNRFVSFGSDYVIYLFVPKYSLQKATFSSKAQIKMTIELKVLDKNNKVIYEDKKDNILFSEDFIFDEIQILQSKEALEKASNLAIRQVVTRLILQMKKN